MDLTAQDELTIAAAAVRLGVSEGTVSRWVRLGLLPSRREVSGARPYRIRQTDMDRFRDRPRRSGERRRLADTELKTAIAALRAGATADQAAAEAGLTARALRLRFTALGLTAAEFRPHPPAPPAIDPHERRRRLAERAKLRDWEREHASGRTAYSVQSAHGRRDLHILLTATA